MDAKNIIKEGFFSSLVRAIIPMSVQKKVTKATEEKLKKQIEKNNKKLQDLEKQSAKLSDEIAKALEKQYGYKTDKKKISDFIGKRK